jgi:hydroxymethylbilane synthase
VTDGEYDGVILAAAALERLGWEDRISEYLPTEYFLPAVGQGVLAVETRSDDSKVADIVVPLNDLPAWESITAERAFLSALGGGCRAPIAALGVVNGTILRLEGMVADIRGKKILRTAAEGSATAPAELGVSLAQQLLDVGAGELLAEAGEM